MPAVPSLNAPRWELYKLLGEPVRLRLLALASEEELAIGELADLLGERQPNVSRHVAPLKRATLLTVRREGTRALARLTEGVSDDPVVADALREGRALCAADGSLGRIGHVVRAREAAAREFFARPGQADAKSLPSELPAYLSALAPLIEHRSLAVDAGTGDGGLLDLLAPIFGEVIGVDREEAQLSRARARLVARGYQNVTLHEGELDDSELVSLVDSRGGADAVFAARVLHHASLPGRALGALSRLARPGGAVVVIDYAAHEDEALRDKQADQWLGFDAGELMRYAAAAHLVNPNVTTIPASRCGDGPDGHLDWQVLVARLPLDAPERS
ncbi:MAG: methyltransferase domain-containing protein [Deltaproteobacteria bacterium]|nr:methyltransferase domain-containing protein [Deltaproteobacteria bacterium]